MFGPNVWLSDLEAKHKKVCRLSAGGRYSVVWTLEASFQHVPCEEMSKPWNLVSRDGCGHGAP
jgi:hypothetical protein